MIPQNIKASKTLSGLASLAAAAAIIAGSFLVFVAGCLVWIAVTVVSASLLASLFPRAETAALAISFGILLLPIGFGVVRLMLHCWPWYDTIVVILWVAFQAYGSQGQPWPSFVVGATALLVVSAVLRWVHYVCERRLLARSDIPA